METVGRNGSELTYAGVDLKNALSSTELEGAPMVGGGLTISVPAGAAERELNRLKQGLTDMRHMEALLEPNHMIFRKATGGGYQTTWSVGVDLISHIVMPMTPTPRSFLWKVQAWNSDAKYCPKGAVVVDLMFVVGSSYGMVTASDKLFRQLGMKIPTSLRFISPCDACDAAEYIVLVDDQRLCLDCLHKDGVPSIDPPQHLVELLKECGLEKDVVARVILARNQEGYPIALVQTMDNGSWMPCVVNLFRGSNGSDLYAFVQTGNRDGCLSGERAPRNTGIGPLWKSCYGTLYDRFEEPS